MKIITLNACLFPTGLRSTFSSTEKNQRFPQLLNFIYEVQKECDIICLQEVFSNTFSEKWSKPIHDCSVYYEVCDTVVPSIFKGYLMNSGLIILSKFPILKKFFIPFNLNPGWLKFSQKGFLHIVIQSNEGSVNLINTHLHPTIDNTEENEMIRKCQFTQIKDYIRDFDLKNVIICGDFNFHLFSQEANTTLKNFVKPVNIYNSNTSIHNLFYFCRNNPQMLCDYLVTDESFKIVNGTVLTKYNNISDHYPVLFEVAETYNS
jgi:endonuclease/exonuclease/phosphatase family metal-dependent hydrolase